MRGVVIKSTGSWYQVRSDDSVIYQCRIRGKFRLKGKVLTNPVAVGDIVEFQLEEDSDSQGLITGIEERRNYVVRQSPRNKHALHLLASNIDQAILLTTIVEPNLKPGFIDRFLLMTEPHDIPVIIIFNKSDLYNEANFMEYEYLSAVYEKIGYQVYSFSAKEEESLDFLRKLIRNKVSLVSGQSGVGKSTLLNRLSPGLDIKTADLSSHSGKGQHTTTFAEMHVVDKNTMLIDTPGIKTLSFNNLSEQDVRHNFREIFEHSSECKFDDCEHINEPGCAVKAAVEQGEINEMRYFSYLNILDEISDQNKWERHRDY